MLNCWQLLLLHSCKPPLACTPSKCPGHAVPPAQDDEHDEALRAHRERQLQLMVEIQDRFGSLFMDYRDNWATMYEAFKITHATGYGGLIGLYVGAWPCSLLRVAECNADGGVARSTVADHSSGRVVSTKAFCHPLPALPLPAALVASGRPTMAVPMLVMLVLWQLSFSVLATWLRPHQNKVSNVCDIGNLWIDVFMQGAIVTVHYGLVDGAVSCTRLDWRNGGCCGARSAQGACMIEAMKEQARKIKA